MSFGPHVGAQKDPRSPPKAIEKELIADKGACIRSGSKFQGRWRELWALLDDVSWALWKDGDRPDVQVTFLWMRAHQRKKDAKLNL